MLLTLGNGETIGAENKFRTPEGDHQLELTGG